MSIFFQKNIFYTKGLSDNSVKDHLTEIDINNIRSFLDNLQKIEKDKKQNEIKLKNAYKFYHEHCDEKRLSIIFKSICRI